MIIEITTYKPANDVIQEELIAASKAFNSNYCSRCKGLIRRQFLKTEDGYMDIFLWESQADVEHVQATFMQDSDAVTFAKFLNPETLTMQNHEVLEVYEPSQVRKSS
ncbi:hypothetical protein OAE19_00455 [Porticoccaceae bacterium]|nr:hypothetical protein [Porticoccaceae bacterium]